MQVNRIICGDCLEVMKDWPDNCVDLVLTDPPYPDYYKEEYSYKNNILNILVNFNCPQIIFWSPREKFPLDYTGIHIWDKRSNWGMAYERIFIRNKDKNFRVYSYVSLKNDLVARWVGDIFTEHPSQKPIRLIARLLQEYSKSNNLILDPFCGSGTTCVAAKMLSRRYIGIDISEKYCEIARQRLEAVDTGVPVREQKKGQQPLFPMQTPTPVP